MNITWHGYSCFKISENNHNGEVSVVTDPFTPDAGGKMPRNLAADIVTVSHKHPRHNFLEGVGGEPFVIDGPGEYEVKEVLATGIATYHEVENGKTRGTNVMFYLTVGDIHILHLGDLKHTLDPKHQEHLRNIDILMVPVGGGEVLDAKMAAEITRQLEPRVVIPMHYRVGEMGADMAGVEEFLKQLGATGSEALPKLKIAAKDLPQDQTRVVILDPQ